MTAKSPSVGSPVAACPDAERLAAYADGTLTADEARDVEWHLASCDDCREVLSETMAFAAAEAAATPDSPSRVVPFRPRGWVTRAVGVLAAAAALVFVARLHPEWIGLSPRSDRRELQE